MQHSIINYGLPRWQRIHLPMQEMQEMWVLSLSQEDPLEKETAAHSQHSCLGKSRDRGAWWATVCEVTKSRTQLCD